MSDVLIERLGGIVKHTNIVMRQYATSLAGMVWLFYKGSLGGRDGLQKQKMKAQNLHRYVDATLCGEVDGICRKRHRHRRLQRRNWAWRKMGFIIQQNNAKSCFWVLLHSGGEYTLPHHGGCKVGRGSTIRGPYKAGAMHVVSG
jgi:hypothetical protein